MAGLGKLWTALIIIGLFTFLVFGFIISFIDTNKDDARANPALNDNRINDSYNDLNTNLGELGDTSQAWYNATSSDSPSVTMIFLILPSMAKLPFTMFATAFSVFKLVIAAVFPILFGNAFGIIFGVITALAIVAGILAVYRLIRTGDTG
jgi:uncharacterized protein with PQ loop repeat